MPRKKKVEEANVVPVDVAINDITEETDNVETVQEVAQEENTQMQTYVNEMKSKNVTHITAPNGFDVSVDYFLSHDAEVLFYNFVTDKVFDSNGTYHPENKSMYIDIATIICYTDMNVTSMDFNDYYSVMYGKNTYSVAQSIGSDLEYDMGLLSVMHGYINLIQYDNIIKSIDEYVKMRIDSAVERAYSKAEEVMSVMNEVTDKMSALFDGITKEDLDNIVNSLSNGRIDEASIIKAYLSEVK